MPWKNEWRTPEKHAKCQHAWLTVMKNKNKCKLKLWKTMWTLQSHKVVLKMYNYWQFSTDHRLANMSASSLCLSFDFLAAGRLLEEAAVDFSQKKECNCNNVLSSQVTGLCRVSLKHQTPATSVDVFKNLCPHKWNQQNFRIHFRLKMHRFWCVFTTHFCCLHGKKPSILKTIRGVFESIVFIGGFDHCCVNALK